MSALHAAAGNAAKPAMFVGMTERRSPGYFRKMSSLIEILRSIIATDEPALSATNAALSPTASVEYATLLLSIVLRGTWVSLGQLMYLVDRSLVDISNHQKNAAKVKNFVHALQ